MKKTFSIAALALLLTCSSCEVIHEIDSGIQTFNQHMEGWITLFAIIGAIAGLIGWFVSYLNKHTELLKKDSTKKHPLISFFKGYSLFRQLNWDKAFKAADEISEILEKEYYPTMIVCIGRGGAIFGSLISYGLSELTILALDRTYTYDENGNRKEYPMYPFRIPKTYLQRVLLVAGESHTRKTLKIFNERLKAMGAKEIRNCVFYNQTLPPSKMDAEVEIHYWGEKRMKDYLMPWQTNLSLHPSENKSDADRQNNRIKLFIDEKDNCFSVEEFGFYCMRHAETLANSNDCFIGSGTDIELSSKGKDQAREVGRYFKRIGVSFDYIFYSPTTRCFQTAKEIAKEAGGEIVMREDLVEFDYGEWEGMERTEIEKRYPVEYEKYCQGDGSFMAPNGSETIDDVRERVRNFIGELMLTQTALGKNVLVVTHKTFGRILYQTVCNGTVSNFRDIPMENASVGYVSVQEGKTRVILDNKTC